MYLVNVFTVLPSGPMTWTSAHEAGDGEMLAHHAGQAVAQLLVDLGLGFLGGGHCASGRYFRVYAARPVRAAFTSSSVRGRARYAALYRCRALVMLFRRR